ncbi:MAG TPA: DoxX family protein, partial [Bryobacteraceae bacterium]|nr:DoxX family protein [Bryobacteraceae bacterium]
LSPVLATIELVCVVAYVIPRTSILGAILLTGYFGGAVAIHLRVRDPLFDTLFPIIIGLMVWGGLYLRNAKVRALIPFITPN